MFYNDDTTFCRLNKTFMFTVKLLNFEINLKNIKLCVIYKYVSGFIFTK